MNHITVHHSAATSLEQVLAEMQDPNGRQVSSNYVIGNAGEIVLVVPEELRAWTSGATTDGGRGAAFDRRSITVEIINAGGAPGYPISQAAIDATVLLFADVGKRYHFTMDRAFGGTFEGHRELYTRYGASYATACPGVYPLDSAAAQINTLIAGGSLSRKRKTMQLVREVKQDSKLTYVQTWAVEDNGTAWAIPEALVPFYVAIFNGGATPPVAYRTSIDGVVGDMKTHGTVAGSSLTAAQIAAAVDGVIDDEAIMAAVQSGNSSILGKLATLPADTLAAAGLKRV